MGGREMESLSLGPVNLSRQQRRAAAEHPRLTATQLAADPVIAAGLRELLNALGLTKERT